MNYVIVGNSAAAVGAIESIRCCDGEGEITVVSREQEHVYSRPLIAHYLAGEVGDDRMAYRPDDFYSNFDVKTLLGREAVTIDPVAHVLRLDDGTELSYDRLLLTPGSRVTVPPLEGKDLGGVGTFQTYEDARRLSSRITPGAPVVVIGAGLIGMRAAYGLKEAGADVTIVELLPRILSRVLDEKGSEIVRGILERGGIKVLTSTSVSELRGEGGEVTKVVLGSGEELPARAVVISTGVVPDTRLVEGTAVKVNRGIVVNHYFQTNFSDIFAAGDAAETYDIPRGRTMVNANWPNAHEQGRYAGRCMAGDMVAYPGSLGMNSVNFFGVPVVSLGLFDPESEDEEEAETKKRENRSHDIYQKLVFKDNLLKGAVFVGDLGYCGAVKDLIKDQMLAGIIKDSILEESYQLYSFLRKKRQEQVEGRDIEWPETYTFTQRYEKAFDERSWTEREKDKRSW